MRNIMLIIHFLGLALAIGNSFSQFFLGLARKKMSEEESKDLFKKTLYLNYMGKLGLTLLFISGGYLMTPYWGALTSMPLLMTKLILFLVLSGLIVIASVKAKKIKNGTEQNIKELANLTNIILLLES